LGRGEAPVITRRQFFGYSASAAGALVASQAIHLPDATAGQAACRWGAFVVPGPDPLDPLATTRNFETEIGRRLGMTRHYLRWDFRPIPSLAMQESANGHRVPFVDWRPQKQAPDNGFILWGDIAKGLHDAEIDKVGAALASWNKTAYFTFNHEPENDAIHCGTASEYKAAYTHIKQRFTAAGVTKLKYVCTLVQGTFKGKNGGPDTWFPNGAQYVGADGYNRSKCSGGWKTFETLFKEAHDYAFLRGRNMVIEEWGCAPPDACGGTAPETKADWFNHSAVKIKAWPEIKAVIYTNVVATYRSNVVDFTVDSSGTDAASKAAYIAAGHDPYFNTT
jgi:hypothetical protein